MRLRAIDIYRQVCLYVNALLRRFAAKETDVNLFSLARAGRSARRLLSVTRLLIGATLITQSTAAQKVSNDPHLDPQVRAFLTELNKARLVVEEVEQGDLVRRWPSLLH